MATGNAGGELCPQLCFNLLFPQLCSTLLFPQLCFTLYYPHLYFNLFCPQLCFSSVCFFFQYLLLTDIPFFNILIYIFSWEHNSLHLIISYLSFLLISPHLVSLFLFYHICIFVLFMIVILMYISSCHIHHPHTCDPCTGNVQI